MPKEIASLKLDFKIDEQGILRIIDLGDGFGAALQGFEDIPIEARVLRDVYEASGAPIAPVFGELLFDAMHPETINIPIVLRPHPSSGYSLETKDLPNNERILPYSYPGRISSFVSSAWTKQKDNVLNIPIALMALEMHKIFWYFLIEKHVPTKEQQNVLYWSNEESPNEVELDKIDLRHGCFIKIADRSIGGGGDVYYAKDKKEILSVLNQLQQNYKASAEQFKKHIFILEPAYVTVKQHAEQNYNVTGRAFVTLFYDKDTQALDVKIAGAKWMFPLEPMASNKTQDQMLSNIKHSIKMLSLTAEELKTLSSGILGTYGETFKAGFINDDLIAYCKDHSMMKKLLSCLRPNAAYTMFLDAFYRSTQNESKGEANPRDLLISNIATFVARDYLKAFNRFLELSSNLSFFPSATPTLNDVMKKICTFSFFENYIAHMKTDEAFYYKHMSFIASIMKNQALVKSTLDRLISQYLQAKKYDAGDVNRALRQAAAVGDTMVIKLLIYTRRADLNALSPTNKTALDYAMSIKNGKEKVLQIFERAGGLTGAQVVASKKHSGLRGGV